MNKATPLFSLHVWKMYCLYTIFIHIKTNNNQTINQQPKAIPCPPDMDCHSPRYGLSLAQILSLLHSQDGFTVQIYQGETIFRPGCQMCSAEFGFKILGSWGSPRVADRSTCGWPDDRASAGVSSVLILFFRLTLTTFFFFFFLVSSLASHETWSCVI
jgi:hypothetical protein